MKTHASIWLGVSLLGLCAGLGLACSEREPAAGEETAPALTALRQEITVARERIPRVFEAVQAVRQELPALDRAKRGRYAIVTPLLRSLGPEALLPMLEALLDEPDAALGDTARIAWRVGLLEAVGRLRDARSVPVLERMLDRASEPPVARAATEALGKLGTDRSIERLLRLARTPTAKGRAVLSGLGEARRLEVASFLGDVLRKRPDRETARVAIRSLRTLGNAWAWQTDAVAAAGDGDAVRRASAEILIGSFAASRGNDQLREAAAKALLVVDHPDTPALIEAARGRAGPAQSAALDELAERFADNPLHRYAR